MMAALIRPNVKPAGFSLFLWLFLSPLTHAVFLSERFSLVEEMLSKVAGNKRVHFNQPVYLSEKAHSDRNCALAHYMVLPLLLLSYPSVLISVTCRGMPV